MCVHSNMSSQSYKPKSRTCRSSICHFYLQCMIDLLNWSSPVNSCTRFWFYLVLNLALLIVCVKASQEFLNNECPPWSAMQTGVLRHWLFYIFLNLQLLILHVKVARVSQQWVLHCQWWDQLKYWICNDENCIMECAREPRGMKNYKKQNLNRLTPSHEILGI
jgi:hypothetical protein